MIIDKQSAKLIETILGEAADTIEVLASATPAEQATLKPGVDQVLADLAALREALTDEVFDQALAAIKARRPQK